MPTACRWRSASETISRGPGVGDSDSTSPRRACPGSGPNRQLSIVTAALGTDGLARTADDDAAVVSALRQPFDLMRCPSDVGPDLNDRISVDETTITATLGGAVPNDGYLLPTSNYVAANSSHTPEPKRLPLAGNCDMDAFDGVFAANSSIRFRDVTDGLSNTVFAGERMYGKFVITPPPVDSIVYFSHAGTLLMTAWAYHSGGPSNHLAMADGWHAINNFDKSPPWGYSSWHPGGAQFVLGDGSVRFISENIDHAEDGTNPTTGLNVTLAQQHTPPNAISRDSLFEFLLCRNDGEVLDEF